MSRLNEKVEVVIVKAGFKVSQGIQRIRTQGTIANALFKLRVRCDGCRKYTPVRFHPSQHLNTPLEIKCEIGCKLQGHACMDVISVSEADFNIENGDITSPTRAVKRQEVLRLFVKSHKMSFATENREANQGCLVNCNWTITLPINFGQDIVQVIGDDSDGVAGEGWRVSQAMLYPELLSGDAGASGS